jgi:hypothetical protein
MAFELSRTSKEAFLARARAFEDRRWNGVVQGMKEGVGLDAALVFDTTGSMSVYLNEVRRQLQDVTRELGSVPRARVGVVCYKDHGDEGESQHYLVKTARLSGDLAGVSAFLNGRDLAPGKGGGGAEALECALRAANGLEWRLAAKKALVIVGDKPPHGAGMDSFDRCPARVDYRVEVEALAERGVRIYAVAIDSWLETRRVFEWMAETTGGKFLQLEHARDLASTFVAACLHVAGQDLDAYAGRLEVAGLLTDSKRQLLLALAG